MLSIGDIKAITAQLGIVKQLRGALHDTYLSIVFFCGTDQVLQRYRPKSFIYTCVISNDSINGNIYEA